MLLTKTCSKCGNEYPLDRFIKNKSCKDGRANICRECQNRYSRDWKQRNASRLAPIRREQYAERYGAIQREKERIRKEQHPLRVRCQLLRNGMLQRSKQLGIDFDSDILTVGYLMSLLGANPYCECCGKRLDIGFKLDACPNNNSPSIDRVVPRLGYTKGNIAILCWRCNNLKRDATSAELRQIAHWMDAWGDEISSPLRLDKVDEAKSIWVPNLDLAS